MNPYEYLEPIKVVTEEAEKIKKEKQIFALLKSKKKKNKK